MAKLEKSVRALLDEKAGLLGEMARTASELKDAKESLSASEVAVRFG
jgi:hypothetical protein